MPTAVHAAGVVTTWTGADQFAEGGKMKAVLLAFLALPVASAPAAMLYEPFNYTSGQRLSGQTDTNVTPNQAWNLVGTVNTDPTVTTGSLSYPGVPVDTDSPGNSALTDRSLANASRINLPAAAASGTVYYSMVVRATDLTNFSTSTATGITSTGSFFAGFSNTQGAGTSITSAGAPLMVHRDPNNASRFQLGIGVATGNAFRQFDTAHSYGTSDTLFVVGSYSLVAGSDNDSANLYVFANGAPVPQTEPLTPNATSGPAQGAGGDLATGQILAFFLRNNSLEPDHLQVDDLRIDTSWAGVIPEPSSAVLLGTGGVAGLLTRRGRRRRSHSLKRA
jgi:hypothetical protein